MAQEKENFLKKLQKQAEDANRIERSTVGQSSCLQWQELHRNLLTASNFGKIKNMRASTSCASAVKNILYKTFSGSQSTEWGMEKEPIAKEKLQEIMNINVEECGLFINKKYPYLGASPDGLVGEDVIVEVKCPFNAKDMTIEEGIAKKKIKYLPVNNDEIITNKRHPYFAQIQGHSCISQKEKYVFSLFGH